MKKRIGLITFHASHNLGSLAQTYAMQYIISEHYGEDVTIIDFSSEAQRDMYSIFPNVRNWKVMVKNTINLLFYGVFRRRYWDFQKFIIEKFKLTERCYFDDDDLRELEGKFDVLICGSDQIWNVTCTDFHEAYFLNFDNQARKIAYAVSMGGRSLLEADGVDRYKTYINNFDEISVRERNGQSWVSHLTEKPVVVVADPTLLVPIEVWDGLVEDPNIDGDYIFFYGVPFSPKTYDAVADIGRKLSMPVVMLDAKSYIYRLNFLRGIKLHTGSRPQDYFGLIKNAKLVITTSFHGTIFSTLFKKDFWTITFEGTNKDDDRVETLLDQLGLKDRFVYLENLDQVDLEKKVDYSGFDERLRPLRERSLEFLDNALKEND